MSYVAKDVRLTTKQMELLKRGESIRFSIGVDVDGCKLFAIVRPPLIKKGDPERAAR